MAKILHDHMYLARFFIKVGLKLGLYDVQSAINAMHLVKSRR